MAYISEMCLHTIKQKTDNDLTKEKAVIVFNDNPEKDDVINIIAQSETFTKEDAALLMDDRNFMLCGFKAKNSEKIIPLAIDLKFGEVFVGSDNEIEHNDTKHKEIDRVFSSSSTPYAVKDIELAIQIHAIDKRMQSFSKRNG